MNSSIDYSVSPNFLSSCYSVIRLAVGLVLLWVTGTSLVSAVEMTRLYETTVVIADQSIDARETAHEQALREIFIRASGNVDVVKNPAIKKAVNDASRYVVRYQYLFQNNQQKLLIEFDQQKINQLLRNNELNIWGTRRPQLLMWMAVQEGQQRLLLGESTTPQRITPFEKRFEQRGLPVVFPLLDLDDISNVNVSDVWGQFDEYIASYSERYPHDEFILARQYMLNAETAIVDWVVYEKGNETCTPVDSLLGSECLRTLEAKPENIQQAFADVVADYYAEQYAVSAAEFGDQRQVILPVLGVDSVPKMMAAEARLESLSAVFDCQIYQVQGSKVVFKLSLVGEITDVYDALELDSRFKRIFDPLARPVEDQPREYRWLP